MIPTLTHTRFERYKETFRRTLDKVPSECDLIFTTILTAGGFTDFTGDSERSTSSIHLKCLYKREFTDSERTKFGLHIKETGLLWISPLHLIAKLGTYIIDQRKFHVNLMGSEYMVDRVVYKDPFYNSCIAIEIHLIDMDEQ